MQYTSKMPAGKDTEGILRLTASNFMNGHQLVEWADHDYAEVSATVQVTAMSGAKGVANLRVAVDYESAGATNSPGATFSAITSRHEQSLCLVNDLRSSTASVQVVPRMPWLCCHAAIVADLRFIVEGSLFAATDALILTLAFTNISVKFSGPAPGRHRRVEPNKQVTVVLKT